MKSSNFIKLCFSRKCAGLNTTRGVIKDMPSGMLNCPDCGSVVVIKRESQKRRFAESSQAGRRGLAR